MKITYINKIVGGLFLVAALSSCTKSENSPGYEYMPDMYRSPAIEAYVDYGEVRSWKPTDSLKDKLTALQPPFGTIPFTGVGADELSLPYKRLPSKSMVETHGVRSLHFSETDYEESVNDMSPIAYNLHNAKKGEVLYGKFCDHCHGEKGKADGKVAEFVTPTSNAFSKPEGQMFYSITYGRNAMGSHASQLNKRERWEVIQYLKVLNNGGTFPKADIDMGKALTDLMAQYNANDSTKNKSLALDNLVFNTGSANLNKRRSAKTLKALLSFLETNNKSIILSGHTDNVGDAASNLLLSQNRADAVKNYLVSNGIEGNRIETIGFGSKQPKINENTAEARAANRRTEVTIK